MVILNDLRRLSDGLLAVAGLVSVLLGLLLLRLGLPPGIRIVLLFFFIIHQAAGLYRNDARCGGWLILWLLHRLVLYRLSSSLDISYLGWWPLPLHHLNRIACAFCSRSPYRYL